MQIATRLKTAPPESAFDKALEEELLDYVFKVSRILNAGIKFSDNISCAIVTVADTGNADTEFTVAHTLKRAPLGFILININKAGIVYDSGTSWTVDNIYLKCNAANCAIKVIVI